MYRHRPLLVRTSIFADLCISITGAYYAPALRVFLQGEEANQKFADLNTIAHSPFIVGLSAAVVPMILSSLGFYLRNNLQRTSTAMRQIVSFFIIGLASFSIVESITPKSQIMVQTIILCMFMVTVAIFLRFLLFRYLQTHTRLGENQLTPVLLIGKKDQLDAEWKEFPKHWKNTTRTICFIDVDNASLKEAQQIIEQNHIGIAMFFGKNSFDLQLQDYIELCKSQGIDVYINLHSPSSPKSTKVKLDHIGDKRILIISSRPEYSWSQLTKDLLERLAAILILLLSFPLWLLAAFLIKKADPAGPIFFSQPRSGRFGKPFCMWKFRTMYTNAEAIKKEVMEKHGNEMNGPIFKLTNDPRVIPYGNLLRKTSIDELPQLLNIIFGDMSLVGPRPLPTYETELFPEAANRRRLSVKPGLTCYWQIEDRSNNPDFDIMIQKDLKYIDNWSLWLDIKLFFRTIPAVLLRRGAK